MRRLITAENNRQIPRTKKSRSQSRHDPAKVTKALDKLYSEVDSGLHSSLCDWNAIQETLYLLSIPGMRESIRKGLRTPLSKTSEKPGW
jgi:hypothetical protein